MIVSGRNFQPSKPRSWSFVLNANGHYYRTYKPEKAMVQEQIIQVP